MNKYQDAFEKASLCCLCTDTVEEANEYLVVLKELVDKATPKKVSKKYYTTPHGKNGKIARVDIRCPICSSSFADNIGNSSIGIFKSREYMFIKLMEKQKYCRVCGQAISWENEQ